MPLHDGETREAWDKYLICTQGLVNPRYEEVEPWAWNQLQVKLRAIMARKKVTTHAA